MCLPCSVSPEMSHVCVAVTSSSWWRCAGRSEGPPGFSVRVCLLGTEKSSFFNKWCLWGREGGVDFVNVFCSQRTLNFCCLLLFFSSPSSIQACDSQVTSLPPEAKSPKTSIFTPADFPALSLHFPGAQASDLFSVFPHSEGDAPSGGNFHLFCY